MMNNINEYIKKTNETVLRKSLLKEIKQSDQDEMYIKAKMAFLKLQPHQILRSFYKDIDVLAYEEIDKFYKENLKKFGIPILNVLLVACSRRKNRQYQGLHYIQATLKDWYKRSATKNLDLAIAQLLRIIPESKEETKSREQSKRYPGTASTW